MSPKRIVYCAVKTCSNTSLNFNGAFFAFPADKTRAQEWARLCGRLELVHLRKNTSNYKVCKAHFLKEMFKSSCEKRLINEAFPSLNLKDTGPSPKRHRSLIPEVQHIEDEDNPVAIQISLNEPELSSLLDQNVFIKPQCQNNKSLQNAVIEPQANMEFKDLLMRHTKSASPIWCQVCLKESSNETLFPITTTWTSSNEKDTIKDKLLFCVPSLNIADDSKICRTCLDELNAASRFIAKCLKAEITFSDHPVIDNSSSNNIECVLSENIEDVPVTDTEVNQDSNSDADLLQDCDDPQQDFLEVAQNNSDLVVSCSDKNQSNVLCKVRQDNEVPLDLNKELDFSPYTLNFVSASMPISSQQSEDMLKVGINTIDMSTNLNGKKRVIFVARNYYPTKVDCHLCNGKFISTCDILDHSFLHQQHRIVSSEDSSFPCKLCFQKFSDEEALKIHCAISHKVRYRMHCNKCKRPFQSINNLLEHKNEFKDSDKCAYKCRKCSKDFATKTTLEAHIKDVADAPCCDYVLCKVCLVKFTKTDFKEHRKIHPSYLCSDCGKSFASSTSLRSHTFNVHKNLSVMCHKCGQILKSADALRSHLQNRHENIKPLFACDKCPEMFKFNYNLSRHILMRHSEQPPKISCTMCQRSFFFERDLKAHIKKIHDEPKRYECNLCSSNFSRRDYLNRHLSRHDVYVQFTCAICKMSFASEWRLKAHEDLGHDENGKARKYARGGRGGRTNRPTRSYQSSIKRANKPCICKICHKVLGNRQYLKTHYKIHLRIREKKCEKCGLVITHASSYGRHMKLHEDPEFDMRCKICYVTKSSKLELQEHLQTVHKHLKYECRYCGKRFGRKHLMYSHESLEHKETTKRKKEALKIINEEPVFVPDGVVVMPKPRKGTKLSGYPNTDVDDLIKKISHGETVIPDPSWIQLHDFNILSEPCEELDELSCDVLLDEVMSYKSYEHEDYEDNS